MTGSTRHESQQMTRTLEAVTSLKANYAEALGDDEDLIADTLEGETDLHEIAAKITLEIGVDEALIKAINFNKNQLNYRADRIQRRINLRRGMLQTALEIAELKKLETSAGTISLTPVPAKLIIVEEADIPSFYWNDGDPVLDRKALAESIKSLAPDSPPIKGATMSNGGTSITIRRG